VRWGSINSCYSLERYYTLHLPLSF